METFVVALLLSHRYEGDTGFKRQVAGVLCDGPG